MHLIVYLFFPFYSFRVVVVLLIFPSSLMTDEQDADPSSQQPLNIARRGHTSTKEIEPIDSSSSASIPGFFFTPAGIYDTLTHK
jgi:hypothetical protein